MNWPRLCALLAMVSLGAFTAYALMALIPESVSVPYKPAGPTDRDVTDFAGDVEHWLRTEGH